MSKNLIVTSVLIVVGVVILIEYVNKNVILTYMDEEFHYDQTEKFYNGNFFEWNNKLTTFPGLFIISGIILRIYLLILQIFKISYLVIPIDLYFYRSINLISSVIFSYVAGKFKLFNSDYSTIMFQLIMCLLPINYFYNFLFYTDTLSNLLIITYYYLNLTYNSNVNKFIIGSAAVLVRQNNIIWLNLFALCEFLNYLLRFKSIKILTDNVFNLVKNNFHVVVLNFLFILFFIKNNFSVVLGDKNSHSLSLHLAQLNHLLTFSLFFFPMLNTKIKDLFNRNMPKKKLFNILIFFTLVYSLMVICNKFSHIHEFILSDNRHYSFYYFKKIYLNIYLRHSILIYTSLIFAMILSDNNEIIKDTLLISSLVCICLILIPSRLFEFRYLTPCYLTILVIIHYNSAKWKDLHKLLLNYINLIWMILINLITLAIFTKYPFTNNWFNGEISRFMW